MDTNKLFRYVGETKQPLQIENTDGSFTIIKRIKGIILTKEVISPDLTSGAIDPLIDEVLIQEYELQVELVEESF